MSKPKENKWYLYRAPFGGVYHVYVLRAGKRRSVCRWTVKSDFLGDYEKAGFKWNYRLMER